MMKNENSELRRKLDDMFRTWQTDRQQMLEIYFDFSTRLKKLEAAVSELMVK